MLLSVALLAAGSSPAPDESRKALNLVTVYGEETSQNTLVSVPVRGVILSGSATDPLQSLFGQGYADGERIKEQLMRLADDNIAAGVVLEIDSPGGMITASKAIADGIEYYREKTNKPVVAHINSVGASGGYWVASATDAIYAEQGSETGSIGVIMGPLISLKGVVAYGDVATTEPISFRYFTAGRSKDLGSPFRDITPEEEAYLNQQLGVEYEKFVSYVASNRDITAEQIKGEIGALTYGTDDAKRLGLIDDEMSKEEVYAQLADTAGVSSDFKVKQIDSTADFFGSLFGVRSFLSSMRLSEADKAAGRARFCETTLLERPLVYSGDIRSVCQ